MYRCITPLNDQERITENQFKTALYFSDITTNNSTTNIIFHVTRLAVADSFLLLYYMQNECIGSASLKRNVQQLQKSRQAPILIY